MRTCRAARSSRYPRVILATACIPWTPDYRVDERCFRAELRHLVLHGIDHIYLFGTAGEGYAVDEARLDAITRLFVRDMGELARAVKRPLHPMVGVIHLSTAAIRDRIRRVRDLGIRDFQISLPAWGALTERETFAFFHEVCDAFPDCRFLHYNLLRAKRLVTVGEYARLAAEIPNLVATKNGSTDLTYLSGLMNEASALRHFITEIGFAYASLIGDPGYLISLGCTHLPRACRFFEAARRRDSKALLALQAEFIRMLQELMVATEHRPLIDGAYDKMFCRIHDPRFPLRLLPPYETTTDAMVRRYVGALRKTLPIWVPRPSRRALAKP